MTRCADPHKINMTLLARPFSSQHRCTIEGRPDVEAARDGNSSKMMRSRSHCVRSRDREHRPSPKSRSTTTVRRLLRRPAWAAVKPVSWLSSSAVQSEHQLRVGLRVAPLEALEFGRSPDTLLFAHVALEAACSGSSFDGNAFLENPVASCPRSVNPAMLSQPTVV